MSKLRVLELFGGIGACSKALERLGIDYEIADYVEIDKYAVKSFNAIHGTNFEPQDIRTYDKDVNCDLIMHGSPCQDFSLAGKQAGGDKDSGTRSSLLYETIRIVKKLKPKYVIWENVKNVISKKHRHNFDNYLQEMESFGYTNYWQVLNAKDYGIPQNRERVFTISILGDENYEFPKNECLTKMPIDYLEENIDKKYYLTEKNLEWLEEHNKNHKEKGTGFIFKPKNPNADVANTIRANASWCPTDNAFFEFPPKQELKLKLKDMLEDEVDEKYYLSDKMIKYISAENEKWTGNNGEALVNKELASTINTGEGSRRCDASNYIIPGVNEENINLKITEATKQGYKEANEGDGINISSRTEYQDRGVVVKNQGKDIVRETDVCNTLMARDYKGFGNQEMTGVLSDLRIRKLTPKECWRLMGFSDNDFDKASKVNSNAQLYKQAGNSIVVNVLMAIFGELFDIERE